MRKVVGSVRTSAGNVAMYGASCVGGKVDDGEAERRSERVDRAEGYYGLGCVSGNWSSDRY